MAAFFRCGKLFTGRDEQALADHTVVAEDGRVTHVGPTASAPEPGPGDSLIDHSAHFVMPGLIDGHVHVHAGNAQAEENMDIYAPLEFRALRGLVNAQRMFSAGYTGMIDGGTTGRVSLAVRDAINAGLFPGPRMMCSGGFLTTRQGAPDMYPSWFNNPYSLRLLATSIDGALESIRTMVKDGVDCVKLGLDGRQLNFEGGLAAAFSEGETLRLAREAQRLGKWVKVHANGTQGLLYGARAGARVINHAADVTDEVVDALLESGTALCPQLALICSFTCFTQPTDNYYQFTARGLDEWARTVASMRKAYEAGVPIIAGSDAGFACVPFGEWHALEMKLLVDYCGLTPAESLRAGTSLPGDLFPADARPGTLAPGYFADIVAFEGDPLADIGVIVDKRNVRGLYRGGEAVTCVAPEINADTETNFSYRMWQQIYDQKTVAGLEKKPPLHAPAGLA